MDNEQVVSILYRYYELQQQKTTVKLVIMKERNANGTNTLRILRA